MNVKRKADIEHSLAMIEVMNQIKYVFGHGPLARKIQDNISPIAVERVRQTTNISLQERKRPIVWMAHSVHVFNDGDVMVFGGENESHFCREYNISLQPVIPIHGSHFADTKVTPPEDCIGPGYENVVVLPWLLVKPCGKDLGTVSSPISSDSCSASLSSSLSHIEFLSADGSVLL
jgi:hypothetical protein